MKTCQYCNFPASSLGMCDMHYQRVRRNGDPHAIYKPGAKPGRWRSLFLAALQLFSTSAAAEKVTGVAHDTVRLTRHADPEFARAYEEAINAEPCPGWLNNMEFRLVEAGAKLGRVPSAETLVRICKELRFYRELGAAEDAEPLTALLGETRAPGGRHE